jgi:hypothetical protein
MTMGPGKYDDLCTTVREDTAADAVILIVLRGNLGSSFCVQALGDSVPELPVLLEHLAAAIRQDAAEVKH